MAKTKINKKEPLGQIVVQINKDNKSLNLFYKVVKKLAELGYVLDDDKIKDVIDYEYTSFFLHLDKDIKYCYVGSSILVPACMAGCKRRPIPISWMYSKFDKIMSNSSKQSHLRALEHKSYIKFIS